jgi:hypothetical protein
LGNAIATAQRASFEDFYHADWSASLPPIAPVVNFKPAHTLSDYHNLDVLVAEFYLNVRPSTFSAITTIDNCLILKSSCDTLRHSPSPFNGLPATPLRLSACS